MSAAAAPMALSAMQQMQSSRQAAENASARAKYQTAMASSRADARVADLHKQTETQKRQARNAFLRRQARRRVQGAVSGAGASAEVLAGAAADNERELVSLDRQADEAAARIRAGADLTEGQARAKAANAKRSARHGTAKTLLGLGGGIANTGTSLFDI